MNGNLITSSNLVAVIGMGATGFSVARFLKRQNKRFIMLDTRKSPPNLSAFLEEFPGQAHELGPLSIDVLSNVSEIVLSPGLAANDPVLMKASEQGTPVIGDIQLFADYLQMQTHRVSLVAITGSNGKSTVTTLVGEMAKYCGLQVGVGGNLSPPALDLLADFDETQLYVLELSSFQLETTENLNADVAVILNVSADHMDRYRSIQEYHAAKQRIFQKAKTVVVNRGDPLTLPLLHENMKLVSYGLDTPDLKQFGLIKESDKSYLAYGQEILIGVNELKIVGRHNVANALAALAIGSSIDLPMEEMLSVLRKFSGLKHRCQWLRTVSDVDYINDSKGTNVGATLAALQGLARPPSKIVLIAGGDGKGADFSSLKSIFKQQLRALIALGKDADRLAVVAQQASVKVDIVKTMDEAVMRAAMLAEPGDLVLLSPACASLDMYENYMERGDAFASAVRELAA